MMSLPNSTWIHKRLPKEEFYRKLSLNRSLKAKFISDVETIFVDNSLTMDNLNLQGNSDVEEILVVALTLKKQAFDPKILEAIARQNPHKLVFILMYEGVRQLAILHDKLYCTPWLPDCGIALMATGSTLDEIWNGFVEQIALRDERPSATNRMTLEERLQRHEKIVNLEMAIQKMENAAWTEKQPKKKFEIFTKLKASQRELQRWIDGESPHH